MSYNGAATLIAPEGAIPIRVQYVVRQAGLTSWAGAFVGDVPPGFGDREHLTLALPDGRSGQVLLTKVRMSSGAPTSGTFQGSGPPP